MLDSPKSFLRYWKKLKNMIFEKREKVLKMKKHGGDRGDRHRSCRSPTIVLYRAVKVLPGTAGTVLNFIIIKERIHFQTARPSSTQHQHNPVQQSYQNTCLQICFQLLLCWVSCFVLSRIVWGGGGGYVIKSKHNITIPCPILCLWSTSTAQRFVPVVLRRTRQR